MNQSYTQPAKGSAWPAGDDATGKLDLALLEAAGAEDLLRQTWQRYGDRAAIGTSLQKSGVVMIDLAARLDLPLRVFFVDTLLNHDETYTLLATIQQRYGLTVERFEPAPAKIEWLFETVGQYAHFFSRETCCEIRKKEPLRRALATVDCWISGLRLDQSDHRRASVRKAGLITEQGRDILKLNPLMDWTGKDIDRYIAEHDVPYSPLYDYESPYGERYDVIGCVPCHIPTKSCLGCRAGKFPWEQGIKECGMHEEKGSGI